MQLFLVESAKEVLILEHLQVDAPVTEKTVYQILVDSLGGLLDFATPDEVDARLHDHFD